MQPINWPSLAQAFLFGVAICWRVLNKLKCRILQPVPGSRKLQSKLHNPAIAVANGGVLSASEPYLLATS